MMLKGLRKRLARVFTAFTGTVLAGVLAVSYYLSAQQIVVQNEMWFSNAIDSVASTAVTRTMNEEPMSGIYVNSDYLVYVTLNGEAGADAPEELPFLVEEAPAGTVPSLVGMTAEEAQTLFVQAKNISEEEGLTNWVSDGYQMAVASTEAAEPTEPLQEPSGSVKGDMAVLSEYGFYFGTVHQGQGSIQEGVAADDYVEFEVPQAVTITMGPVLGNEGVFKMQNDGNSYRATYYTWDMWEPSGDEVSYEVAIMEDLSRQTRQLWLSGLLYLLLLVVGLTLLYLINWFLARLVLRPTEDGLRRQTEFVAAASHELRSPLAVIRSSLSAAEASADEEEAGRFRDAATQEAERMSHLVDDLLLLAGGDAGSWSLNEAQVDLDTLLIDAAEVYRPLGREKGVGLELELPEETLPPVRGDAERLRQILAVLMDNALQYAPENTDIRLSAKVKKGKVRISVADAGRGVPDEEKEKVFERFYQADGSRHDKAHFGLGLSVARELAELHGGALTVADTKGGGATFTLKLPI